MLPILRMYLQLECHMQYNTGNKVENPGLSPVYLLFTLVSWGEAGELCDEFPVVNCTFVWRREHWAQQFFTH